MEGKISRSLDHSNWWEPDHWKMRSGQISTTLGEADPAEIRNGWLTLPDPKVPQQLTQLTYYSYREKTTQLLFIFFMYSSLLSLNLVLICLD